MRAIGFLLAAALLAAAGARPADAQILKRVTERVKQKVVEKKVQTEETALNHATEPADSALTRAAAPVESLTARAGGAAGAAVAGVGRSSGGASSEQARLREQLTAGRADLPAVQFESGSAALTPAGEPALAALAAVLLESPGPFLIQGRADPGAAPADAPLVASARATTVKAWLSANGVPPERIFAAGDGAAMPEQPLVTVVVIQ